MAHPEQLPSTYADSFKLFLDATNEKDVFVEALAAGGLKKDDQLLDIGAGDGELSTRILTHIQPSRYVGIEHNPDFVTKLSKAGVTVIDGTYPIVDASLGDQTFDTVLTSYSAPLASESRLNFVKHAFKRVRPAGRLHMISFGTPDQWTDIADEITGLFSIENPDESPTRPVPGDFMEILKKECSELGYVEARTISSEITAPTRAKLLHAIAFIATGGINSLLKQYYESEDAVSEILAARAPHNTITQHHSFVTLSHEASNE